MIQKGSHLWAALRSLGHDQALVTRSAACLELVATPKPNQGATLVQYCAWVQQVFMGAWLGLQ